MSPAERSTSNARRGTLAPGDPPLPIAEGLPLVVGPVDGSRSPEPPGEPRRRATRVGTVVSDRMQKTIVVEVERRVQEARYQRTIRRTSRFMAHDEENAAKIGDRVRIEETRPQSRRKRWRLREILTRAEA